ncbi:MAG: hypothetical protein RIA38_03650, partial [Microcella pacifica]
QAEQGARGCRGVSLRERSGDHDEHRPSSRSTLGGGFPRAVGRAARPQSACRHPPARGSTTMRR